MSPQQNNESSPHWHAGPPRILHRDDDILVLEKPAGMHVFPLKEGDQAVMNYLLAQSPELANVGDARFPAIVHRLDQGTSGLLVAARSQNAYRTMRALFQSGAVRKIYLALVEGELSEACSVAIPIGARHRHSRKVVVAARERERRTVRSLRRAMTTIHPLGVASGFSLCRVEITTGVRHQIRAHLSHLGHPIAGDTLYGATQPLPEIAGRFFLHAWRIELAHPINASFECPLPENLRAAIARLGIPLPK